MFIYDISKVPANKRKLQSRQKYSLKNDEPEGAQMASNVLPRNSRLEQIQPSE